MIARISRSLDERGHFPVHLSFRADPILAVYAFHMAYTAWLGTKR